MALFLSDLQREEEIVLNARILKNRILVVETMILGEQKRIRKLLSFFVGAVLLPTLAVQTIAAIKAITIVYVVPITIAYLAAISVTYVVPISLNEQKRICRLLSFFFVAVLLPTLAVQAIAAMAIAAYFAPFTAIAIAGYVVVSMTTVAIAAYGVPITAIASIFYIVPITAIFNMVYTQHNLYVLRQDLFNIYRGVNTGGGQHLGLWNLLGSKQILLAMTEELMLNYPRLFNNLNNIYMGVFRKGQQWLAGLSRFC